MTRSVRNWDDLRVLLAAVRSGTVSRAAGALGMDPTTVTRRLRALEAAVGATLFERMKGGLVLTTDGEALHALALSVDAAVAAELRAVDARQGAAVGTVRVGIQGLLELAWSDRFVSLAAANPGLRIALVASDDLASLDRREVDVVVRMSEAPPAHLVGRRLGPVRLAPYGTAEVVSRPRADAPWVGWSDAGGAAPPTARVRAHHGFVGPTVLEVSTYGALVEAARRGHGLAVLPVSAGAQVTELVAAAEPVDAGLWVWVLTHPDLRQVPRVRVVMDGLYAHHDGRD
jgi:DNA-binding transcriptional LysR family regulator